VKNNQPFSPSATEEMKVCGRRNNRGPSCNMVVTELHTNRQASRNSRNPWWINDTDMSLYSTVQKRSEGEGETM